MQAVAIAISASMVLAIVYGAIRAVAQFRLERALAAQMAVEIWNSPLNGYWRHEQRITAVRQRMGLLAPMLRLESGGVLWPG